MSRVKFFLDSGANIKSLNSTDWLDTEEDLALEEGQWESMSYNEKIKEASYYWAENGLPEVYFEEEGVENE